MDRTQSRWLVALSALVVAVAGVLAWQGEPEVELDPGASAAVWSVQTDQVVRVEVHRGADRLVLAREGEQWKVEAPFQALADQARVQELVRSLAQIEQAVPVAVPEGREGEFGLGEPPTARVTLSLADGGSSALDVGTAAAVGYRTYVRTAEGGVGAATGDPGRWLLADPERFRDVRVFRYDPAAVREVSVTSPEGRLSVRGQGRRWTLEGFGRADPDRVDDWITGLLDLRFDRALEGVTVETPRFEARVRLEGGEEQVVRFADDGGGGVTALHSDGRAGTIAPELLAELGRGPTDVGQRQAFLVVPDRTDLVRFEGLGKRFEARRNGPEWVSEGSPVDVAAERVGRLSAIPVEYDREPPPAFDAPEVVVTVEDPEDPPVVWELGPALPDGRRALRERGSASPGLRVPDAALVAFAEELP